MLVAELAACAETAFDVVERATIEVESLLVVRELAVVASACGLVVIEFASVIIDALLADRVPLRELVPQR